MYVLSNDDLSFYSDYHKDAYGFRPRGSLCEFESEADFRAAIDRLEVVVTDSLERERVEGLAALREFEEAITRLVESGAGDRATALRWLYEAEDDGYTEIGYFLWSNGIPYILEPSYKAEISAAIA